MPPGKWRVECMVPIVWVEARCWAALCMVVLPVPLLQVTCFRAWVVVQHSEDIRRPSPCDLAMAVRMHAHPWMRGMYWVRPTQTLLFFERQESTPVVVACAAQARTCGSSSCHVRGCVWEPARSPV